MSDENLIEAVRTLAGQIDPLMVGGSDARLLKQAADRLQALTTKAPNDDALVEAIARGFAAHDLANWDARHFGETPNGETPEEMREGYMDRAHFLLPIIRAHYAKADAPGLRGVTSSVEFGNLRDLVNMQRDIRPGTFAYAALIDLRAALSVQSDSTGERT